jgi:hypothetical protein
MKKQQKTCTVHNQSETSTFGGVLYPKEEHEQTSASSGAPDPIQSNNSYREESPD